MLPVARLGAFALLFIATGCGGGSDGGSPNPLPGREAEWDELEKKAEQDGTVPLLVTLDVETRPEGYLRPGERAAQRARIAETRTKLLAELEGTGYANVRSFDVIPVIALDATPRTIEALRRSRLVAGVEEDIAAGVGSPGSS